MSDRVTDTELLLTALRAKHGDWLEQPYQLGVMVHSRVANLRKQGYRIECRRFGAGDYRYRLIEGKSRGR